MIELNQRPPSLVYLAFLFCMIITGCNSDSSGAKETQQLDNDEDPTAIERPQQDPLLSSNESTLDANGEFVVIQEFNENDWKKISQDIKLESVDESKTERNNSQNLGAEAWKPWGAYQYRIVYFTEGGSLKGRPMVRNENSEEVEFSSNTIDSLQMGDLWTEIQRSSSNLSSNYK